MWGPPGRGELGGADAPTRDEPPCGFGHPDLGGCAPIAPSLWCTCQSVNRGNFQTPKSQGIIGALPAQDTPSHMERCRVSPCRVTQCGGLLMLCAALCSAPLPTLTSLRPELGPSMETRLMLCQVMKKALPPAPAPRPSRHLGAQGTQRASVISSLGGVEYPSRQSLAGMILFSGS